MTGYIYLQSYFVDLDRFHTSWTKISLYRCVGTAYFTGKQVLGGFLYLRASGSVLYSAFKGPDCGPDALLLALSPSSPWPYTNALFRGGMNLVYV